MSEAVNYLQVLSESLDKKIDILKQLEALTAAQKEIIDKGEFDEEAFNDNVDSKAVLIDELEKLDTGFQILYDNIKNQIEGNKDRYKQEIAALQVKIKTITDVDQFFCLSLALQVAEQRNNVIVRNRFNSIRKDVYQAKKNREVASNYYKSMNNISSQSYFMDKKK